MNTKAYSAVLVLFAVFTLGMLPNASASDYSTDPTFNHPLAGERPGKNLWGSYPVLTRSMRAGEVMSITPGNVEDYGNPTIGKFNGQVYWLVPVRFLTPRATGARYSPSQHASEAYACVRNGRVEYWIFKESKSVIR
jgi:hypothetical protein